MATVPGDPSQNVTPMLPKWAQPTMADFLQAAHIVNEKGRLRMAGEVIDHPFLSPTPGKEDWRRIGNTMSPGAQGYEGADPNAVVKGVMGGKVKVLNPESK